MLLFSTLLDINKTMTKDAFIQLVIEWNQESPHENNIIPDMIWNGKRNIRFGADGLWLDIEEYRNENIIAVRYEKKEGDGAIWDTDYVMNFNSMKMAVRLDRSYTSDALNTDPKFSTSHFITLLIERGYIKKDSGQIVTFQAPKLFKKCVDNAVKLYSAGSTETALLAEWDEVEPAFRKALSALKICAEKPSDIPGMSMKEKKIFAKMFQEFDSLFAQLKSFTKYDDSMLETYGITETEYEDYAGHYKNVMEEIRDSKDHGDSDSSDTQVDQDYELMAYSSTKIDYEYIINLIQNIVTPTEEDEEITPQERQKKLEEVKQYVAELRKDNEKVADLMSNLIADIEKDDRKYRGKSILNIIENMKRDCVEKVISDFCIQWYASKDDVMYAAIHYRNGKIPNETAIKATIDYTSYKEAQETALPKYKFYNRMMAELKKTLDEEINPLLMTA